MPDIYEIVNATQLDSDLGDIADAIRDRSTGQDPLAFPNEFISEINSLPPVIWGSTNVTAKASENIATGDTVYIVKNKICKWFSLDERPGTSGTYCTTFNNTGTRLVVVGNSQDYVYVYDTTQIPWKRLNVISSGLTNIRAAAWSPDGTKLALGAQASPWFEVWDTTTTPTYTKLTDPSYKPTNNVHSIAWSPDGTKLAVGTQSQKFLRLYDTTTTPFSDITSTIAADVPNTAYGVAWNPAGTRLAVAHYASPYITIYDTTGTSYTKLSNPGTLPSGQCNSVSWNNDGSHLAVTSTASPYIIIYKTNTTPYSKLTNPSTIPSSRANICSFSPDGSILAVPVQNYPFIYLYQPGSTSYTKLSDPSWVPEGNCFCSSWSPNGKYLAIGHSGGAFCSTYAIDADYPYMIKASNKNLSGTEMMVYGYSNSTVNSGNTGTAVSLFEP